MAHAIEYKGQIFWLSNMHFRQMLDLALEFGESIATLSDRPHIDRIRKLDQEGYFWAGRCFDLDTDFPNLNERKVWARIFLELARAIFERKIGLHEEKFWQAQAIYVAYRIGLLFSEAVSDVEPNWEADTQDSREFDKYYNHRK
jgi:hypothetical protein